MFMYSLPLFPKLLVKIIYESIFLGNSVTVLRRIASQIIYRSNKADPADRIDFFLFEIKLNFLNKSKGDDL